jgi:hypothetical protein
LISLGWWADHEPDRSVLWWRECDRGRRPCLVRGVAEWRPAIPPCSSLREGNQAPPHLARLGHEVAVLPIDGRPNRVRLHHPEQRNGAVVNPISFPMRECQHTRSSRRPPLFSLPCPSPHKPPMPPHLLKHFLKAPATNYVILERGPECTDNGGLVVLSVVLIPLGQRQPVALLVGVCVNGVEDGG